MRIVVGAGPELAEALEELADGWEHFEKAGKCIEAEDALADLRDGAPAVWASHTLYVVADS